MHAFPIPPPTPSTSLQRGQACKSARCEERRPGCAGLERGEREKRERVREAAERNGKRGE